MFHKVNFSGAKYSSIVTIGEQLRKKSIEENREYLYLNRGINQVVTIDLKPITRKIDYNSEKIQYYPPGRGTIGLKKAINTHFFQDTTETENIFITSGGMNALYLTISCLNYQKIYTPNLFWGAYGNLLKIHKKSQGFYHRFEELINRPESFADGAVIICDPNNPSGEKAPDDLLLKTVEALEKHNITVIWDGPYRKLFTDENDSLYKKLAVYENVIITESFSKSIGLSGQRVGFMHSTDKNFQKEFAVRLLFSGNGVNVFAQELIEHLLVSPEGEKAVMDFRNSTSQAIRKNIAYLKQRGLIAKELYAHDEIWGIFVIVNMPEQRLTDAAIGSVGLNYFTKDPKINTEKYARICVSVPHEKFKSFFDKL
jgi:aspartate/methionine/tyrosine aminotransferase